MITWQLVVMLVAVLAVLPTIWRRPIVGVYVMVGAAVVIENFGLDFPDSFTDTFPFFLNLNNTAGLPISATPAELVMLVTLLAAYFGPAAAEIRAEERPARPLRGPYLALVGMVVVAELNGLSSGGDWNHSLWEVRPQVYGFLMFLLASRLVRDRRHVAYLAVILLAGAALKGGIGFFRYFVTMHQDLGNEESILGHEDSYFLALFAVGAVASMIWVRRRKVVLPLLLATPIVVITVLENRRRAALLALGAAVIVVVMLGIWHESKIRVRLAAVFVLFSLAFTAFVIASWNSQNGISSQVVRPIRTVFGQVDQRDYLSDLYRINENADLIFTYNLNPILGEGFGKPFVLVFPLANIAEAYPLWQYIPHNSVLWVAAKTGIFGMAVFWALIAMVVLEAVHALRSQQDPLLRAAAAFAVAAVVAELIVAYTDVQLEAYRNMVFFGVMVGLVEALPRLRVQPAARPAEETRLPSSPALRSPSQRRVA